MKSLLKYTLIFLGSAGLPSQVLAQDPTESEIRRLEKLESEAIMKSDYSIIFSSRI
jgi:hypothetical protein